LSSALCYLILIHERMENGSGRERENNFCLFD
jgi:hypothetical protein